MPPSSPDIDSLLEYTRIAARTLQDISGPNVPLLKAVSGATLLVIPIVQDIRANRERCVRMVEKVHQLLCTLTLLSLNIGTTMSPKVLGDIGRLAQTLQKFYACLRSQQELGKLRRFFKQTEITAQLEACEGELQGVSESFKVQSATAPTAAIADLCTRAEQRHQEILELLETRSYTQSSDTTSLLRSSSHMSSSSAAFSLVPASPQIFHGRGSELETCVSILMQHPARLAILGTGGIGKTSLALALIHHPSVEQKYPHCHFISCESANSGGELISIVGAHLGLEPSRQLSRAILGYFSDCGPAILVLDNMETPWESVSTRAKVEEFLSLLADVPHLALVITMRGAKRPGKVKWTRPFLPPLDPISTLASHKTFVDIAQEPTPDEESALADLIELTGNLPLAVGLMANVASFEGYLGALSRWKTESTALLSDGYDKRSNLEKSITMSLTSPRMKINPNALDLLSLLSLLPEGISEAQLLSSHVPLLGIPECRSLLLQTTLAFLVDGRLKALSPIRDYIRSAHPPSVTLTRPLRENFQHLLQVWESYHGLSPRDLVPQLTAHLVNIHSIFLNAITTESSAYSEIGHGILILNSFSRTMLKGESPLMQYLSAMIDSSHDQNLRWLYVAARVDQIDGPFSARDADALRTEGINYFIQQNDDRGQAEAYLTLAWYFDKVGDIHKALEFNQLGMELATKIQHLPHQLRALRTRAMIESALGKYHQSIRNLHEVQKLARIMGRVTEECNTVADEAIPLCRLGNFPEALECASQGHELLLKNGLQGSSVELGFLDRKAEIHFQKSEYVEARQLTELVVRMAARNRSPYFHANAVKTLAQIDIMTGADAPVILSNLTAARALATELSWAHAVVMCDIHQCELEIRRGEPTKAYRSLKGVITKVDKWHTEETFLSLQSLGEVSNGMCDLAETFIWASTYFAFARKTQDLGHTYQALRYIGDVFLAEGDEETALNIFHAVLDGSTEMDVHRRRADCMSRMGDIYLRRGELDRAKDLWEAAHPLFVRSSQLKEVTSLNSKLAQLMRDVSKGEKEGVRSDDETAREISTRLFGLRAPTSKPGEESPEREARVPASTEKDTVAAGY
ncbi:hypothetical protein DFH09DRAFT_1056595 [Mycena vulgaris]|nr:hypothetical protein DFH09DRAFT_1056595 [Mycena vulgaris]